MLRRLTIAVLTGLLLAGCGSGSIHGSAPGEVRAADPRAPAVIPAADSALLAAGNSRFAGRLLATVAHAQPTVVLSPYSISDTLAMTYAGARGRTASEMAGALDFGLSPGRLSAAFNALDQSLAAADSASTKLRIADALFGQRGTPFREPFLSVLARDYGTGIRTVDFAASPDTARAEINAWASQATDGKIPQLLGANDVSPLTRLVLTNAAYLNAHWASPFTADDTSSDPFYAPGGTLQVPTMHQTSSFEYASHPGYQALELPYQGGRLAFDILLPAPGRLPELLTMLERVGPLELLAGLSSQRIALALPKLLLRARFELADALSTLGMPLAFEPDKADLSGIAGPPGQLSLQHVVHETYVRVDEAGTEAAAATGVVGGVTAVPPLRGRPFDVDRPFVFVLRDTATDAILFVGVVSHP